jgi:integrase/recombinase XerD
MDISITPRDNRNKTKTYYSLEWGKGSGQRMATGIYTYKKPKDQVQKNHNKEALDILNTKKSQMVLDLQATANGQLPHHKIKKNFLDFYGDSVEKNSKDVNRSLACSLSSFKNFIHKDFGSFISPIDITENFCERFRNYLLDTLNGETPADYFMRFKRVIKAGKKQGYFRENPAEDVKAKAHPSGIKEVLTVEEYKTLINAYCSNYEVKKAAIVSMYTGFRWCDIEPLRWWQIKENTILLRKQSKTGVPLKVPLHPVVKAIIGERKDPQIPVFSLPTADGSNGVLKNWVKKNAKIDKHITWHCLRHSVSDILQDNGVDVATVAALLGQTTAKYILSTYKKRVKIRHATEAIKHLPTAGTI